MYIDLEFLQLTHLDKHIDVIEKKKKTYINLFFFLFLILFVLFYTILNLYRQTHVKIKKIICTSYNN